MRTRPCIKRRIARVTSATCAWLLLVCPQLLAQQMPPAQSELPLRRLVVFTSGVGFFEHRAEIEDDTQVRLQFDADDINDLLKSMVVQDLGGGRVTSVTYESKDPITRTLKTFAVDLTENPTLADLLDQIRGEHVELDAPTPVTGAILGVEHRQQRLNSDEVIDAAYINLLTVDGLRSVPLDSVTRIKLSSAELDAELRAALLVLAGAHNTDKKTVTVQFTGQGRRPVRLGYIREAPMWKTSYRLVLDRDEPPLLQGWAIVENTTEQDWDNVALTLVSGRPISFRMNLYDPLYVPRPEVQPELFASLRPQTYGRDLALTEGRGKRASGVTERLDAEAARSLRSRRSMPTSPRQAGATALDRLGRAELAEGKLELGQGVRSVAQAAEIGELFQYIIETPLSLPRRQSAMLPIVNASVQGDKVSIYNQGVHPKHPLNGLRLKNTSGLHLMQGPITVFDGGSYAGDAQIRDIAPDEERLISYAVDLNTEVAPQSQGRPQLLVQVRIIKGSLYAARKYRRLREYRITNSGEDATRLLIEHPLEADWSLTSPKQADEKTRDRYRFAVLARPGEPTTLAVEEERNVTTQVVLSNANNRDIRIYLSANVVSDGIKAALKDLLQRKQELARLAADRQRREQEVAVIDKEQARIRQNMAQLDRNTDLYNRYVRKFTEQEDRVEELREEVRRLQREETQKQQSLDKYLAGLNLD